MTSSAEGADDATYVDGVVSDAGQGAALAALPSGVALDPDDFLAAVQDGWGTVVDVRTKVKFDMFELPWEACNIPLVQMALRADELTGLGRILLVASNNDESARAFAAVVQAGVPAGEVHVLAGGTDAWIADGRPFTLNPVLVAC